MSKIAPTLQDSVSMGTGWSRGREIDDQARAELRALLAVARAAGRIDALMQGPEWEDVLEGRTEPLRRALARLSRASEKGGGR